MGYHINHFLSFFGNLILKLRYESTYVLTFVIQNVLLVRIYMEGNEHERLQICSLTQIKAFVLLF